MGGYGSGRPGRHGKTTHFRSLDVNKLAKAGALQPGRSSGWQWTEDGNPVANIDLEAEAGRLILTYRFRENGGDWQPVTEAVPITQVPCAYGGSRSYFLCPGVVNGRHCGRRVGKLYSSRYFLCRHCLNLNFPVQSEDAFHRHLRKARKKRAALGTEPNESNLPTKPKGMHWRTFSRIADQIFWAEIAADNANLATLLRLFPKLMSQTSKPTLPPAED